MQVAFYGIARCVGTTANMMTLASGLRYYQNLPVVIKDAEAEDFDRKEAIIFTDCTNRSNAEEIIRNSNLLVLNLSIPHQELEEVYFRHSFVQKNIIFLIGKYYQNKSCELKELARAYRIPFGRVCAIPYSPRFQKAYENRQILQYVKEQEKASLSCEAVQFKTYLKHALDAVITYGNSKGEVYYG